ncbi:MAG: YccF domain-containing protein [Clostridiales bacterium]|nr:YccF domain-containing protein [Clostridiales bacterium]
MKLLANILWFLFFGLWFGMACAVTGLLWCVTIVGIPVGLQCFKLASFGFFPFDKEIVADEKTTSLLLNILWIIFGGIELATSAAIAGLILCVTVVGIPFGLQCFKLARLSLAPFGVSIVNRS